MWIRKRHRERMDRWEHACTTLQWGLEVELIKNEITAAEVSKNGKGDETAVQLLPAWVMDDIAAAVTPQANGESVAENGEGMADVQIDR